MREDGFRADVFFIQRACSAGLEVLAGPFVERGHWGNPHLNRISPKPYGFWSLDVLETIFLLSADGSEGCRRGRHQDLKPVTHRWPVRIEGRALNPEP